jgi:hypothetical protein
MEAPAPDQLPRDGFAGKVSAELSVGQGDECLFASGVMADGLRPHHFEFPPNKGRDDGRIYVTLDAVQACSSLPEVNFKPQRFSLVEDRPTSTDLSCANPRVAAEQTGHAFRGTRMKRRGRCKRGGEQQCQ